MKKDEAAKVMRLEQAAIDELVSHGGSPAEIARMREHFKKAAAEKEDDAKMPVSE